MEGEVSLSRGDDRGSSGANQPATKEVTLPGPPTTRDASDHAPSRCYPNSNSRLRSGPPGSNRSKSRNRSRPPCRHQSVWVCPISSARLKSASSGSRERGLIMREMRRSPRGVVPERMRPKLLQLLRNLGNDSAVLRAAAAQQANAAGIKCRLG